MLAQTFQEVVDDRLDQSQENQAARAERDDFIKLHFEQLDVQFSQMIDTVTGTHARLDVTRSAIQQPITNRGFTFLDKTIVEVRSTLYGNLEIVRFTPDLQFVERDQFGVIAIETIDVPLASIQSGDAASFQDILGSGILMRGAETASLVVPRAADEPGFEDLTEDRLESFLETAFIREG